MINVILISDIKIYCEGLSHALANTDSINVIGAVNTIDAAISLIAQSPPHIVVQDMTMTGSCSLVQRISSMNPAIKIIALSVPYDESNIILCAEAGITGYVPREASLDDLIAAVIGAEKGECYCPPKIAAFLFDKIQHLARRAKENYLPVSNRQNAVLETDLTRREKQILSLIADGLSNKQISKALVIEVSTVKNHVHNILVKLDVQSRVQAVSLFQKTKQPDRSRSFDLQKSQEVYS
jgi:DNA-binding NarL/FixJ family response regulator